MRKVQSTREADVAIVSSNAETRGDLQSYLRGAGLSAITMQDIDDVARATTTTMLACIVFPDDFRWESVLAAIAQSSEQKRPVLHVLVTAHPKRYEELALGDRVLVIARPVWGWTILDAIRAHVATPDAG